MNPLKISWSRLRSAEECSMKAALQREGKRAKVTSLRNFAPGLLVDRIMREWLDNPLIRHADHQALVRVAMADMERDEKLNNNVIRWRGPDDKAQVQRFCVDLIQRLEPILEEHVLPYSYSHGQWFKTRLRIPYGRIHREVLLHGEMDLLVQHPEGPVVWDLKGTADDSYYRKVIGQLTFYDVATWIATRQKTKFVGLIQPMCSERLIAWQVTDQDRRELLGRIERYAHSVWDDERTCTKDTATCYFCDVSHACPRFTTDSFGSFADAFRTAAGEPA